MSFSLSAVDRCEYRLEITARLIGVGLTATLQMSASHAKQHRCFRVIASASRDGDGPRDARWPSAAGASWTSSQTTATRRKEKRGRDARGVASCMESRTHCLTPERRREGTWHRGFFCDNSATT